MRLGNLYKDITIYGDTVKIRFSTSFSCQRRYFLHKMTNSRQLLELVFTFVKRQHLAKKLNSEASILTDRLVETFVTI